MSIDARDGINMIMAKELMTIDENDHFSDLYFMMTTLNVRHCPVLKANSKECVRMISKRDLVQQIPPASLISDEEAMKIGLEKSRINTELRNVSKKLVSEVFPSNQQLRKVTNKYSIEEVIRLLAYRQPLGDGHYYISGVPVMLEKEKELVGFVSYVDALKFIKNHQIGFLQEHRVEDIATLIRTPEDVDKISYLTLEDDLAFASIQLQTVRSLPVISDIEERNWLGFVDDLKVKMFSHRLFMNALKGLSVTHFMITANKLPVITPKQTLAEIIDHFLKDANGMKPPSTFVVTEKITKPDGSEYQRVQGVISYTDILKNWLEWRKAQQVVSNVQDNN